ncbi:hypothetical protein CYMTET_15503 [Cymbomonas tetramitiformis]|uniref:Uncharacterized protein n=1 Tax=Cymbomonas tetramitiformis TaxID=36881 RepID=A0AAE0GDX6_9CHLO|nr:hypothetical protein CYMTET_15503 [Cymbomonas tetramitiformis]
MSSAEELAEDLKRKELQAEFERLRAEAKASLNELRSENNTYLKDLRVHGEEIEAAHEKQKDLISELKSTSLPPLASKPPSPTPSETGSSTDRSDLSSGHSCLGHTSCIFCNKANMA